MPHGLPHPPNHSLEIASLTGASPHRGKTRIPRPYPVASSFSPRLRSLEANTAEQIFSQPSDRRLQHIVGGLSSPHLQLRVRPDQITNVLPRPTNASLNPDKTPM